MKQELKTFIRATEETMNKGYSVPEGFVGKMGVIFTKEEYNQHIEDVIKDALEQVKNKIRIKSNKRPNMSTFSFTTYYEVDKESITNTLNDTLNKYKL